jgi:hypothetical protein
MTDDWQAFAMELFGLSISSWNPLPERACSLPAPLDYDILHDGLVELETGQQHMVLQTLSSYQVNFHSRHHSRSFYLENHYRI